MKFAFRRTLLATLMGLSLSGAALAAPPATGLGQSWPNATDMSLSPNFHAYVFSIGGIQYIQINDVNGNVLGGVGNAAGQFIVLPIGQFAQLVTTPRQTPAAITTATPTAAPTPVYNDGTTTVTATPMSDGTTQLSAARADLCSDPTVCGSGGA